MSESLKERLFREPEGASSGLLWISFGIFCFAFDILTDAGSSIWLLLGALLILMAIPELLPPEYTSMAGFLRIVTIAAALFGVPYYVVVFG